MATAEQLLQLVQHQRHGHIVIGSDAVQQAVAGAFIASPWEAGFRLRTQTETQALRQDHAQQLAAKPQTSVERPRTTAQIHAWHAPSSKHSSMSHAKAFSKAARANEGTQKCLQQGNLPHDIGVRSLLWKVAPQIFATQMQQLRTPL